MRYLSLFAGVGGFDLGAERAGWECAGMVERDPNCQAVLEHHWPDVPIHGDVTTYHPTEPVDVIVGGFPCQDVSMAGGRAGIGAGTRSGLYAEIIRIVKEMQHATDGVSPRWVILENVRGLLSHDRGASFGAVLDDLADLGALVIEWGVVNTQFLGPPQRRERVFVVACLDPATASRCPDPLLPLAEGSSRNTRPRPAAGSEPAGRVEGSIDRGGLVADTGIVTALTAMEGAARPDLAHAQAGWLVPALTTRCGSTFDDQQTMPLVTFTAMPDDQGPPKIPGALVLKEAEVAPAIAAVDGAKSSDRGLRIASEMGVRRLTPLECERLQGWPDDHTRWRADGSEQSDTVRYRQIGNGITAPVAAWVCQQINRTETQ